MVSVLSGAACESQCGRGWAPRPNARGWHRPACSLLGHVCISLKTARLSAGPARRSLHEPIFHGHVLQALCTILPSATEMTMNGQMPQFHGRKKGAYADSLARCPDVTIFIEEIFQPPMILCKACKQRT